MIIDIAVGIVLLISAGIAFMRGFIREVLTIAGVAGGMAASWVGGPILAPLFRSWFGLDTAEEPGKLLGIIPHTMLADSAAYGLIFLIVVIALSIVSHFIAEGVRALGLGIVDRTFGVMFGLVRGILLLGLFYLPFHLFMSQDSKDSVFAQSRTHIYLEKTAAVLASFVPGEATDALEEQAKQVEEAVTTRDRLKQIDLLKQDQDPTSIPEGENTGEEGYSEPFRDNMNDLFRDHQEEDNFNE